MLLVLWSHVRLEKRNESAPILKRSTSQPGFSFCLPTLKVRKGGENTGRGRETHACVCVFVSVFEGDNLKRMISLCWSV